MLDSFEQPLRGPLAPDYQRRVKLPVMWQVCKDAWTKNPDDAQKTYDGLAPKRKN
jgi:hypothetical protein